MPEQHTPGTKSENDNILNLEASHFTSKRPIVDADPLVPTPMCLPIDKVDPYDRNPRRAPNPEYDSIFKSLQSSGQDEVLTVTRRPGATNHMIMRGGNTRLAIMKKLWFEERDERFKTIDCLFKPFTSDEDCIVRHLTENDTQGRMTFLDRAHGYWDFKREFERANNLTLSNRKLAGLLKEKGASVSRQRLDAMKYALDIIEPAMPIPLEDGIGRSTVDKIRHLDKSFRHLAQAHNLYGDDQKTFDARFTSDWFHILSQCNTDDWVFELLQLEAINFLSEKTGCNENHLKHEVATCMDRSDPFSVDIFSHQPGPENGGSTQSLRDRIEQESEKEESGSEANDGRPETIPEPPEEYGENQSNGAQQSVDNESGDADGELSPETAVMTEASLSAPQIIPTSTDVIARPATNDITAYRSYLFGLAQQFAQATGCEDSIEHWDAGYGFFLHMPSPMLQPPSPGDEKTAGPYFGWWLLWQQLGLMDQVELVRAIPHMPDCDMKSLYQELLTSLKAKGPTHSSASIRFYTALGGPIFLHVLAQADSVLSPQAIALLGQLIQEKSRTTQQLLHSGIDIWASQ